MPTDVSREDSNNVCGKGIVFNEARESVGITTLLKGLQPQREVPSKDRGRRFAAGNLAGNCPLYLDGNEVRDFTFWTLYPDNLRCFFLGRLLLSYWSLSQCRAKSFNTGSSANIQLRFSKKFLPHWWKNVSDQVHNTSH